MVPGPDGERHQYTHRNHAQLWRGLGSSPCRQETGCLDPELVLVGRKCVCEMDPLGVEILIAAGGAPSTEDSEVLLDSVFKCFEGACGS